MNSHKCSYCDRAWPHTDEYLSCPICTEPTQPSVTIPLSDLDANSEAALARFGWWLWEHERL